MSDPWDDPNIWNPPTTPPAPSTPSSPTAPSSPGTTTPGLKSKSWTNMPDYWQNAMKSWFQGGNSGQGFNWQEDAYKNYFQGGPRYQGQTDQLVGNLPNLWSNYQNLPGQIENKRKTLVDQIYANLPRMQELYQPSMEEMSRKGILNSSITGKALSDIQSNVNRDIGSQIAGANTWAADQNITATTNAPSILASLINTGLTASNQYTGQGQAAATQGTNRQQLINSLMELLRGQGSETYNV